VPEAEEKFPKSRFV